MVVGLRVWEWFWAGSGFTLNLVKCVLVTPLFLIMGLALGRLGSAIFDTSTDGESAREAFDAVTIGLLLFSGALGIALGDNLWLLALRRLGTSPLVVVDALKPFAGALAAFIFLGEDLSVFAWVGMCITMIGVTATGLDRARQANLMYMKDNELVAGGLLSSQSASPEGTRETKKLIFGYAVASVYVVLDGIALVATKRWGSRLTTWDINLIRFGSSAVWLSLMWLSLHVGFSRREEMVKPAPNKAALSSYALELEEGGGGGLQEEEGSPSSSREEDASLKKPGGGRHNWEKVRRNFSRRQRSTFPTQRTLAALELALEAEGRTLEELEEADSAPPRTLWFALPHDDSMPWPAWPWVAFGALLVTFCSPALTTFALFHIPVGLLLTFASVGPIWAMGLRPIKRGLNRKPEITDALLQEPLTPAVIARTAVGPALSATGVLLLALDQLGIL